MNKITIEARRFPVVLMDERTGESVQSNIILDKEQLRAAQLVGQSSKELIFRIFNRKGYRVLDIGKPERRSIQVDLEELWKLHDLAGRCDNE